MPASTFANAVPELRQVNRDPGQLARSTLVGFAEEKELCLIVDRKHTSASYPTEDIRSSALEQGLNAFLGYNLAPSIQGRLVLDGLERERLINAIP